MMVHLEQNQPFDYPNVLVTCAPTDPDSLYMHSSCLIVKGTFPTTIKTAIDRQEKHIAYRSLPSLRYCLLAAQDTRRVKIYSRGPVDH